MKFGQYNIFRSFCKEFSPGGGMHGREACVGGMHGGGGGACVAGGMHGKGVCMAGGCVAGGHAWQGAYVADIMRYGQ